MKNILICSAALAMAACSSGSGTKIGSVVKLQQVGVFCKTWEGESIRGGYSGGSGVVGGIFDFTVEDPVVLLQIKDAMESQREIELSFRKEGFTWCRSENQGNYFATGVKYMDRPTTTINTNSKVTGNVAVHQETPNESESRTHEQKVDQLLQVQADLIRELSKK